MSPVKHTRFFALEGETHRFEGPEPRDPRFSGLPVEGTQKVDSQGTRSFDRYLELFEGADGESALGEASHSYLYSEKAALRIKERLPQVRIIAFIRNPAERAYSHYCHLVQTGREPLESFSEALKAEDERVSKGWWPDFYYRRLGLYGEQLERYFRRFARDQIKVHLYDDFVANPAGVLKDVFGFIGVQSEYEPDLTVRYSTSGQPKSELLHKSLLKLSLVRPFAETILPRAVSKIAVRRASAIKRQNLEKPGLPEEDRERLLSFYREDIKKTGELIGRDLSGWLG